MVNNIKIFIKKNYTHTLLTFVSLFCVYSTTPAFADYPDDDTVHEIQFNSGLTIPDVTLKHAITLLKTDNLDQTTYDNLYNNIKMYDTYDIRDSKNLLTKCPNKNPLIIYINDDNEIFLQNCTDTDQDTYFTEEEIDFRNIKYLNGNYIADEFDGAETVAFQYDASPAIKKYSCKPGYTPISTHRDEFGIYTSLCMQDENEEEYTDQQTDIQATNEPTIFDNLNEIIDTNLKLSSNQWRQSDGKFNTTRLISDSISGVVLGTTGGIITSQIVKKNQLKSGFNDLKCTVDGQDIASFGDEFVIGIQ